MSRPTTIAQVCSPEWQAYLNLESPTVPANSKPGTLSPRAFLADVAASICAADANNKVKVALKWSYVALQFQLYQRNLECDGKNMSDVVSLTKVFVDRLTGGEFSLTPEQANKAAESVKYRFGKLYTPAMSLCCILDPRRKFSVTDIEDFGSPAGSIRKADAANKLDALLLKLPFDKRITIKKQYNDLISHKLFDWATVQGQTMLSDADNMSMLEWCVQE